MVHQNTIVRNVIKLFTENINSHGTWSCILWVHNKKILPELCMVDLCPPDTLEIYQTVHVAVDWSLMWSKVEYLREQHSLVLVLHINS